MESLARVDGQSDVCDVAINHVSELAGSGKTIEMIKRAIKHAQLGKMTWIAQPSVDLVKQSLRDCRAVDPVAPVSAFHGDKDDYVTGAIAESVRRVGGGHVMITTQAALMLCLSRGLVDPTGWHLVVDEIPEIDACHKFNIPETHGVITDFIGTRPYAGGYLELVATDHERLTQMARNAKDDAIWGFFSPVALALVSPHHSVCVSEEAWRRMEGRGAQVEFHSVMWPSVFAGFESVILMGALADHTKAFKLWGIEPSSRIDMPRRRFASHPNTGRINLIYLEERAHSKTLMSRTRRFEGEEKTAIQHHLDSVRRWAGDHEFLWVANNSVPDRALSGARGHRLNHNPHGLNLYQHIRRVAYLSATNASPGHARFLETLGLSRRDLRAHECVRIYQAIMRGNMRDPDSRISVECVVPDRDKAEWLRDHVFPDAKVMPLPGFKSGGSGKPGRPKTGMAMTASEKCRRYRERKRSSDDDTETTTKILGAT